MDVQKNISDNIKLLMAKKNIKAWSELAKLCGLTVPAMQRLINQQTDSPGIKSLKAIADFFDITVDELISQYHMLKNKELAPIDQSHQVPLFDDASVQKWLRLQNPIEVKASDNLIQVDLPVSKNSFAYEILDEDLGPTIPENSILIVDTERKIQNKDYVLLYYPSADKVVVRQLLTDGVDRYTIPIMSAYQNAPHEKLSPEVTVVGVVVKISIYFR